MYIPLNNKTNYTLLSSLLKIDDLLIFAEKNKLDSICIIDRNMYSTMEFIKKCNSKFIKNSFMIFFDWNTGQARPGHTIIANPEI